MKKITLSLCLASALVLPGLVQAKPVTLTTQLKKYSGDGAYMAIYVTDAQGRYQKTLWVSGKKSKYYKNLRDWARGSGMKASEFDGVSGASVGSGGTLKVTADIADALIDAGYEIRIDTAVEDERDFPSEVRAPLTAAGAGKPTAGRGYVQSFTYDM
ncbi:DUF2271 domain-containing protein [Pusillimonas sp. ANT_WB101]|uniref:DUF2271 domain-containing protein n=1 Tax=Pusillimonas sp. ANT_WB101 TaxID=2597356 RepID=UPI0011ED8901|nr:DUF2271 domain-containing protein [Pusillimonas sp. ANT_WB101]KAA0892796.1 DUF2271 domain-containing protein [Pusillimonas sp. ANT_WB101]